MDNLIYSLNATMPVFLVMVVGYILRQLGMFSDEFLKVANKFNFNITLPALLLINMLECDIRSTFDGKYVLYCAVVTLICIITTWFLAKLLLKDKSIVGEFVQGAYRGSAAILGIALMTNISGNADMAPLMILGSVPIYNIFAVIVLTFEAPDIVGKNSDKNDKIEGTKIGTIIKDNIQVKNVKTEKIKKAFIGICKNPIILSILGGMLLSYAGFELPTIPYKVVESIGSMTTPLALIIIGAGFEGRKAIKKIAPAIMATLIKLVIQPAIFLPIAILFGFSAEKIVAALIMLGAPTTATSYIMSKNMGHEGVLSSSIIVLTTLLSAFTITAWIFVLRSFNYI